MAEKFFHIGPTQHMAPSLAPGLHVTATPIGNLGDMTLRALATLAAADVVLCEDTRVTVKLLERYGIKVPMRPYHEHNAESVRPAIIEALKNGGAYALVSDAGVPLVSDPGYRLVRACIDENIAVTALPGASATLTALALSGLPTDRFTFIGFLPQKQKARRDLLTDFKSVPSTLIAFESPHRVIEALADIEAVLQNRNMALARELTKLHEEVLRGSAADIRAVLEARDSVKGEIVLVIGPPDDAPEEASEDEIEDAISDALKDLSASKAAALVSKTFGLPKEDIYARILKRKSDAQEP
ncbi:16S rRNA (cytidine(1402)-2'-O)-methyltransferase [Aestuariivirga litoralis]|uniref:16S rRNA (cytidine(1402)-2'-O)-methyltransferase n=1 Tax=Aestuariivirga litoralis TaxID=2650924 RepID=UPI001FEF299C|nr:16S rRNA (cytidine(1402)-2'-O)-methyltransferase [Aestuariivirga litoralis]